MEIKVGDRFLCNYWRGTIFTAGRVYVTQRVDKDSFGVSYPVVECDKEPRLASIFPGFLTNGDFTPLDTKLVPPTEAGAVEYEEIMAIQEMRNG